MKKHKLMIKTHIKTGLKYLCYTTKSGDRYKKYKGSGTKWKKHLKEFGDEIKTELIFETTDYNEFSKFALGKSIEFDIVNSKEWANECYEIGNGGDTVSKKIWINNGEVDRYINVDENIPIGWSRGRCNCVFNDIEKQKEFSSRADPEKRGNGIKQAWKDGKFDKRDHKKCGTRGDLNPAKRPEIREKMRQAALSNSEKLSERMKKNKVWLYRNNEQN